MRVLLALAGLAQLAAAQTTLPSWSVRRQVFFKKLLGPQAILETVPGTVFDTARNFPHRWGRGGTGIAKRLGSQYGQFVIGETIEMGVSALHHEDPRYFRMPDGKLGPAARTCARQHGGGARSEGLAHDRLGEAGRCVWRVGHCDDVESARSGRT